MDAQTGNVLITGFRKKFSIWEIMEHKSSSSDGYREDWLEKCCKQGWRPLGTIIKNEDYGRASIDVVRMERSDFHWLHVVHLIHFQLWRYISYFLLSNERFLSPNPWIFTCVSYVAPFLWKCSEHFLHWSSSPQSSRPFLFIWNLSRNANLVSLAQFLMPSSAMRQYPNTPNLVI